MTDQEKIETITKLKEYKEIILDIVTDDPTLKMDIKIAVENLRNLQYAILDEMVENVVFDRIETVVKSLKQRSE